MCVMCLCVVRCVLLLCVVVLWLSCACCCGHGCGCGCVCEFRSFLHIKTLPCVLSKRPCHKRQGRFESTHGSVLNEHTGASQALSPSLSLSPVCRSSNASLVMSLSVLMYLRLFSYVSVSSHFTFCDFGRRRRGSSLLIPSRMSMFLLCLSLYLVSCSVTVAMSTRPLGFSVHTALTYSESRSACTLAHSLSGEHVRIMQETINCLSIPVQASCHLE